MITNIVFSGVGGQGVLSLASVVAGSAVQDGLFVKQSEVHGMSQRGGAVVATLRISDREIASPLVSQGSGNLLISMEPLETLRYLEMLQKDAHLIAAMNPVKNIPDYPELEGLLGHLRALPQAHLIDADRLARQAGSGRAANIVLVGAASRFLPIQVETFEAGIRQVFGRKGAAMVELNLKAFHSGREAAAN